MIELNFANMMEEVIGVKGLTVRTLEGMKEKVEEIHKQIKEKKWKELEFLDLPYGETDDIKETAEFIKKESDYFLVLGIGGSGLGPRAVLHALSPFHNVQKRPKVFVYDNADPRTLKQIFSVLDLKRTTINVISKSGSTAETTAAFMLMWDEMKLIHGKDTAKRFIATTDPHSGNLLRIANENGMKTLCIGHGICGRYSVLSPVGLLLAEVIGIDSELLLSGALDMYKKCSVPDLWGNPAYMFGTLLYLMSAEEKRNINIMIPYADSLKALAEWFCQLWAESLGKMGLGMTPCPSVGTTDQHSQLQLWVEGPEDKVLIFLRVNDYGVDYRIPKVFDHIDGVSYLSGHTFSELIKSEEEATELALAKSGRPNMTIHIPVIDAYHLGQLFHFLSIATVFTGFMMGINPFNQPSVEEGKNFSYGMMGKKGFAPKKHEVESARDYKVCWRI